MTDTTQMDDGPLTDPERETIRAAVAELQEAETLSNRQVARAMGCSPSTLIQVLDGRYTGDQDRWLRQARQWMIDRQQRRDTPQSTYVDTADGRRVLSVCQWAHRMPCIGRVVLPSGHGKTEALREYARRVGDRAIYMQAGEQIQAKTAFIQAMARGMGLQPRKHDRTVALYFAVRDRLARLYAGGERQPVCLLVDEPVTLAPRTLNMLRNLHDDAEVRLAIVLADTDRLAGELHGRSAIKGGYEQLQSRCGAVYEPDALRAESYGTRCAIGLDDVRSVAAAVIESLGGGHLDAAAARYCWELAQRPGGLRNVVWRLRHVAAQAAGKRLTPAWSADELDYVAPLVGADRSNPRARNPFATQTRPAAKLATA